MAGTVARPHGSPGDSPVVLGRVHAAVVFYFFFFSGESGDVSPVME